MSSDVCKFQWKGNRIDGYKDKFESKISITVICAYELYELL